MIHSPLRLAAIVLAAGAGARFSAEPGAKLGAELDGEPVLSHVLRSIGAFAPAITVVVLGHGADEIERRIDWAGEVRVHNPTPERGLASSIAVGLKALEARLDDFDGTFIVLGDQPRLRTDVLHSLAQAAAHARPADRPLVAPFYEDQQGPRNPVLLLRPAWPLVHDLAPDRGFGDLIDARPDMVQMVPVPGAMPDIDTPEDLTRLRHSRPPQPRPESKPIPELEPRSEPEP